VTLKTRERRREKTISPNQKGIPIQFLFSNEKSEQKKYECERRGEEVRRARWKACIFFNAVFGRHSKTMGEGKKNKVEIFD